MFQKKVCSKCKVEKDEMEFHRQSPNGAVRGYCKPCRREFDRKRREKRKLLFDSINVYDGTDKVCYNCGGVFPKEKRYWTKDASGHDGLHGYCRVCSSRRTAGYGDSGDLATDLLGRLAKKWTDERRNKRNKRENSAPWINHSEADFFDMLVQQQRRCAVSGVPLTPENASIDHIVPVVKGGTHELSNLRLVAWGVNQAMNSLSDEDFIELCRQVVNYQFDILCYGNKKTPVAESTTGVDASLMTQDPDLG